MRLTSWNRNFVGTHFGGSLYSMCDPFFVLILSAALGRDYVVWDKAAAIRFLRPGRGTVKATFWRRSALLVVEPHSMSALPSSMPRTYLGAGKFAASKSVSITSRWRMLTPRPCQSAE